MIYARSLIHKPTKAPKEHSTQVDEQCLSHSFLKTIKRSNAYPDYTGRQVPSFHEIRALAIFMHKKIGKSAQSLAWHTTESMAEKHASEHKIVWNDADAGIKFPFADVP